MRPDGWLFLSPRAALCASVCAFACALCGCNQKPGFDERYDKEERAIHASANAMERELTDQMTGAAQLEKAEREAAATRPTGNETGIP